VDYYVSISYAGVTCHAGSRPAVKEQKFVHLSFYHNPPPPSITHKAIIRLEKYLPLYFKKLNRTKTLTFSGVIQSSVAIILGKRYFSRVFLGDECGVLLCEFYSIVPFLVQYFNSVFSSCIGVD